MTKKQGKPFHVLVVDDEPEYREVLSLILKEENYQLEGASSGFEALEKLRSRDFDLVLTDLTMPAMDGVELLEKIKKEHDKTEVIIVTGFGTIENAVAAMKKGAFSYFIKGGDPADLLQEIARVRNAGSEKETEEQVSVPSHGAKGFTLATKSRQFQKVLDIALRAAQSNVNILILGESGVGKEIFAKYIHEHSGRRGQPFVPVNCQAFSTGLLESELFGHEKGAFTGAAERRKGRFEAAGKGTLFLDEIGDVPLTTQVKLLRVIENKKIERLGSNDAIDVDFRLISATNKDLAEEILAGRFREDFFYRISTISIVIPALKNRREDLPLLIDFFLEQTQKEYDIKITNIEPGVMRFLLQYDYPGNVRELKNIVERLVVLSQDGVIFYSDLPEIKEAEGEENPDQIVKLKEMRQAAEAKYIAKVLNACGKNVSETSKILGISRRQLFNKINEYGIK